MKRVFICADHGLAAFFFLQSDILATLLKACVEVVVLTEDNTVDLIAEKFGQPGVAVEGLRLDAVKEYVSTVLPTTQWWLDYLRRAGAAAKINRSVPDAYMAQVRFEARGKRRVLLTGMELVAKVLQRSQTGRRMVMAAQRRFTPDIYGDLFEKYQPDLVIAGSPGFRQDRYLLREAAARDIPSVASIISWDSSSSYGLPGADVDWLTCWSEIQKDELVGGADWDPTKVQVVGMPPYDHYARGTWLLPREAYFRMHNLDPDRKLLSYASSFVSWSPNIQNVEALADLVIHDRLSAPAQLLVRLHPIHMEKHYVAEAERIRDLAREHAHIHVAEPVPLGDLGHYSGEDMSEKTSMMAHSDIFLTVYSTMVVEAAFQGTPTIGVAIDSPVGWPGHYSVPMTEIGVWPTHSRFRTSDGGQVANTPEALRAAVDRYLQSPAVDREAQGQFLQREVTFTDGTSGEQAAKFYLSLLENL
jgi:hypothetical protein